MPGWAAQLAPATSPLLLLALLAPRPWLHRRIDPCCARIATACW
jgi:hypothetical protein